MKLWLDTHSEHEEGWIVSNALRAMRLLDLKNPPVEEISLCHNTGTINGEEFLMYLYGMVQQGYRPIPLLRVHAVDPKRKARLHAIVDMIDAIRTHSL